MMQVESDACSGQGFSAESMKPWKVHWDHQLYKGVTALKSVHDVNVYSSP